MIFPKRSEALETISSTRGQIMVEDHYQWENMRGYHLCKFQNPSNPKSDSMNVSISDRVCDMVRCATKPQVESLERVLFLWRPQVKHNQRYAMKPTKPPVVLLAAGSWNVRRTTASGRGRLDTFHDDPLLIPSPLTHTSLYSSTLTDRLHWFLR